MVGTLKIVSPESHATPGFIYIPTLFSFSPEFSLEGVAGVSRVHAPGNHKVVTQGRIRRMVPVHPLPDGSQHVRAGEDPAEGLVAFLGRAGQNISHQDNTH